MILADSGYLIALAKPKDELHQRAVAWSRCIQEPLLVSEHALWETVNYLSLPRDRTKVHALVEQVMHSPLFEFISRHLNFSKLACNCTATGLTRNGRSLIVFRFI